MKNIIYSIFAALIIFASCKQEKVEEKESMKVDKKHKEVVYQVFTRLFGNTNTTNKPWGTIEENGVGKFNDFTEKALQK